MTNDPYGLTLSGIPPELQAEYRGLTRQQALQEALLKQGMAPGGEAINAGKFIVRRSPLEGIAKILQAYMGQKGLNETDAKFSDLGKRHQEMTAAEIQRYMQTKQGIPEKPAIPMPPEELGGGPERAAIPAVAGDPRAAMTQALLSRNPMLQKLGALDYTNATKAPEKYDVGDRIILRRDGVTVGTLPKTATPDAVARQAGEDRRFAGVSGNTAANNAAQAPLRAAQATAAGVNSAANAANATYNTGTPIQGAPVPTAPTPPATNTRQILQQEIEKETALLAQATDPAKQQLHKNNLEMLNKELSGQPGFVTTLQSIQSPKARDAAAVAKVKADEVVRNRPMTAAAQKELMQTDEEIQGGTQALSYIGQAKAANKNAMGFTGAGAVASLGTLVPDVIGAPLGIKSKVENTQELDNIIQNSALPQLKAIFGGMPTEGERKILLDVQGSSSKPASVREKIFERAEIAINNRLKFAKEKARSLRQGSYFSGNGGVAPDVPATPNRRASDAPGAVIDFNSLPK